MTTDKKNASDLKKAQLIPIEGSKEKTDKAVTVQFNPSSLRIQSSVMTPGGSTPSSLPKNAPSNLKKTLTVDLHFDTYDEGTTANPVSVVDKTKQLEQFVKPAGKPQGKKPGPPPAAVLFKWDKFQIKGTVNQLSVEYDHFHHLGAPLRAKCSLSIEAQEESIAADPVQEGARKGSLPDTNVAPPAKPPSAAPDQKKQKDQKALADKGAPAQANESLANFAQRNGLDPRNWRDLAEGIPNVLSLPAGIELAFSKEVKLGFAGSAPPGDAGDSVAAVTKAGGVLASIKAKASQAAATAVREELIAFGLPPSEEAGGQKPAGRPALRPAGSPLPTPALAQRAFGAGVPLRPMLVPPDARKRPEQWSLTTRNSRGCGCSGR